MILLVLLSAIAAAQDCPDAAVARASYDARRYDQAVVEFTRAVARCGASSPLLLALAQSQVLAKRPADALASLDRIPQDDPDYVPALKVKARALYLLARDSEAEAVLKRAAAQAPADAEIPYHLGRIYYQLGKHADAAESFRHAVALDAGAFRAWDNLGLALEALGETTQAQQHYLKAIALVHKDHPTYDVVYANFADLMIKLGDSQRAFDLATEAAQRNPSEPRNFFLAGKALVQAGRSDLSVKWFEQAVALNPDYPEPHYQLSQVYRRLGRPDDAQRALKAFRAVTAAAPKNRR